MPINNGKLIIWFVALLVGAGIIFSVVYSRMNHSAEDLVAKSTDGDETGTPTQESMGDPIGGAGSEKATAQQTDKKLQETFQKALGSLIECLQIKATLPIDPVPVSVDSILALVQGQLGPATQLERWTEWRITSSIHKEQRYRLEVTESDDGTLRHELQGFNVDEDGIPVHFDLPEDQAKDTSDEVIESVLKSGSIIQKDKAGAALFVTGEKIEYTDVNGALSQLEFEKGGRIFRCENLANNACQCLN